MPEVLSHGVIAVLLEYSCLRVYRRRQWLWQGGQAFDMDRFRLVKPDAAGRESTP